MALHFSLDTSVHDLCPPRESAARRKVLVTGAGGSIGRYFAEHSRDRYDLRLMVRDASEADAIRPFGDVVEADVTSLDDMKRVCEGMHAVLHLAGDPKPDAKWDSLFPVNIGGTYNTFAAAKDRGVKRVVFASSIHAVSGYPRDLQVHADDPPNPGDLYGVSKVFGEALGRYMAEHEGVACVAVRIGAFQPRDNMEGEGGIRMLDAYVSRRDLNQLLQRSIEADHVRFAVVHGLSDNRFKRMDITDARQLLGYQPQDDILHINEELKALNLDERIKNHFVGDHIKSGLRKDVGNAHGSGG